MRPNLPAIRARWAALQELSPQVRGVPLTYSEAAREHGKTRQFIRLILQTRGPGHLVTVGLVLDILNPPWARSLPRFTFSDLTEGSEQC